MEIKEKKVENVSLPSPKLAEVAPNAPGLDIIPKHADVNPFAQENRGFYSTMFDYMNQGDAPETPEQKAKREKRERARASISAFSDGIADIANIWGASKGAAPMKLTSLSEANQKRYDYADKIRRENEQSWKRGMLQARMADRGERMQSDALKAKYAKDERDFGYKAAKDARDYQLNIEKYLSGLEQKEKDSAHKAAQLEETKRANQARENVASRNAESNRMRAEASRVSAEKKGGKETGYYAIAGSDNKPIRVRKEAWKSYTGEIAQKIIDASKGDKSITNLINAEFNLNPSGTLETIVDRYLHKFPEIEEYARTRAEELETAYSGVHPISNETNPNYNTGTASGIDWSEIFEIPEM